MFLCGEVEPQGIKTVLMLNEFAGSDGTTPSLAETTPQAEYIVSAGNNDYRLTLPPAEQFVGSDAFPGLEGPITGAIVLPLTRIHSSTNQLGFNRLSCRTDAAPITPAYSIPGRPLRVAHFLNQFFGQIGGEDKAHAGLQVKAGAVGPGLALKEQLSEQADIVATVICGDNTMAENLDKTAAAAVELIADYKPDLLMAGPCFNAGRYGMACGAVCKSTGERLGIPTVMGVAETNPAVEVYHKHTFMVPVGNSAAKMRIAVKAMADVALTLSEGRYPEAGSFLPRGVRELILMETRGATRAVAMLAARLSGEAAITELPLPKFDRVDPAPPLHDVTTATIILATEGGLAPKGNPDRIEMSMATRFGCYSLEGLAGTDPTLFAVAHGGYDNRIAQEDPNRLLPLDVLRELEAEKAIGNVAEFFYTTSGNATSVENATRFGKAIAEDIHRRCKENVGVIFTAT
jgi:glycine reductase